MLCMKCVHGFSLDSWNLSIVSHSSILAAFIRASLPESVSKNYTYNACDVARILVISL